MKPEMAINDAQLPSEVSSRLSTSAGKSKYSFRLFFFTALSVLACAAALANVAAAATPAGEDQYIEKAPTGTGTTNDGSGVGVVDTNGDGVVTEAEVEKAAAKKKARAKKENAGDDGASGATGAAGTTSTPTPPAAQSVATAAKFGPVSRSTALIIGALMLLAGLGAVAFGGAGGAFGIGGDAGDPKSSPPTR